MKNYHVCEECGQLTIVNDEQICDHCGEGYQIDTTRTATKCGECGATYREKHSLYSDLCNLCGKRLEDAQTIVFKWLDDIGYEIVRKERKDVVRMTDEQAHTLQNMCDLMRDDMDRYKERIDKQLILLRDSIPCSCGQDD